MKYPLFSKFITLGLALLLAASAFAGSGHKGNLQVFDPVQVNGKQLPAGDYTVTWTGEGPNVNVSFARGGKVLATATAMLVPLEQKAEQDSAEVKTSSTGGRDLTVLQFSGQKYQLKLGGDTAQGQTKSGDAVK